VVEKKVGGATDNLFVGEPRKRKVRYSPSLRNTNCLSWKDQKERGGKKPAPRRQGAGGVLLQITIDYKSKKKSFNVFDVSTTS